MGVRADLRRGGRHHAYEPLVRRLPGPCFRAGQHGDFPVRGVPAVRGPRTGGYAGRFMGVFDTRRPRLPAFSPLLADYPQYARRRGGERFRGGTGRGKGDSHELAGAGGQPPDVDHRRIVRHRPDGRGGRAQPAQAPFCGYRHEFVCGDGVHVPDRAARGRGQVRMGLGL